MIRYCMTGVLAVSVLACSYAPGEAVLRDASGSGEGAVFARVEDFVLSESRVSNEYGAFVRSHFPRTMWEEKLKDKAALAAYGERMAVQLLLIAAFQAQGGWQGEDVELLLRAAMRETLAEIFLRRTADLGPLVTSPPFLAMNEGMVERLYKENKAAYDREKVNEETAKMSLRYAIVNKRRELIEEYLFSRRLIVIKEMMQKLRYSISHGARGGR